MPQLRGAVARAAAEGIEAEVELRRVETAKEAERERFLGSPTVRVDGADVEPGAAAREDFGLECRLYRTAAGLERVPPAERIKAALRQVRAAAN
ncbi:MAG: hypothetical protein AB7V58_00695 [Solirubrobacterales bacterium]